MNEKINADIKFLKFILNKNKDYILPVVVILFSVILFFQFVIPQFGAFLAVQKEAKDSSLKLEALEANLDILANVNEETLDLQLKTLNLALPTKKDFVGILNSIYLTSQRTGVSLGNFSFKIGDIAQAETGNTFSVISMSLPINSSVAAVNSFVEAISGTIPLAEVNSVKVGNSSSTVNLSFYYKSLDVSKYNLDDRISPVSQKGLAIIEKLNKFNNISSLSETPEPVATSSALE